MPGKLVWGYDITNKIWLPILVDSTGRLKVDMSAINLGDLADVAVAAPSDGDLLAYSAATGLWIPLTHINLSTGVHGVGSRYVAETSVEDLDLASHVSRHEDGGDDELDLENLEGIPYDVLPLFTRSMDEWWKSMNGWTQDTAGLGGDTNTPMRLEMYTGANAGGRDSRYTNGCRGGPHISGQRLITQLWLGSLPGDCEFRFYIVHGDEAAAPLVDTEEHGGFKIVDGDIYASVADGAAETSEDTGEDIAQYDTRTFEIRGINSAVEFYVERALVKTISTNIPQDWGYRIVLELKNTAAANKIMRVYFCRHKQ